MQHVNLNRKNVDDILNIQSVNIFIIHQYFWFWFLKKKKEYLDCQLVLGSYLKFQDQLGAFTNISCSIENYHWNKLNEFEINKFQKSIWIWYDYY